MSFMTQTPNDEYQLAAPVYDFFVEPMARRIRRDILKILASCDCRRVLDLCCGTGKQASLLASAGHRVIGLDLSSAMLAKASRNRAAHLDWVLGDAEILGFENGAFDAGVVSFALHEKPRQSARHMLRELQRVLRTGARLLIVDFDVPRYARSRIAHKLISRIERAAGRRHFRNYRAFLRDGGLAPLLAAADFQVNRTRHYYSESIVLVDAAAGCKTLDEQRGGRI
jgi:ubiquinone/menaquinone biosynthesis C-methylase UbiE